MLEPTILLGEVGASLRRLAGRRPATWHFASPAACIQAGDHERAHTLVVRSDVQVDARLLALFGALRHLIRAGSGLDNIDQAAVAQRGIILHRNAEISAAAVAEAALFALGGLARCLVQGHEALRRGQWSKATLLGEPLSGLRVAVWGAGTVGRACWARAAPLCRDVAFAAWPSCPARFSQRSAEALEREADVHLLCLPLRPGTHAFLDEARLARMRERRPYIINVGRFGLMHLPSVHDALRKGHLRGVYVDPVEQDDVAALMPLLQTRTALNFLAAPHLGAQRADVQEAMSKWVAAVADRVQHRHAVGKQGLA